MADIHIPGHQTYQLESEDDTPRELVPYDFNTKRQETDETFKRHMARLRSSSSTHSRDTICDFLTTHTYLRGAKFNFKDHEYQQYIINDPSPEKVVIKSAQMGISEMSARIALAMGNLIDGFSTIYTLPSAQAAQNFMKTRIDPVIQSSPYLKELVSSAVDNTMIKRFGESYLYLKGAQVDSQAISVPADMLIGDEVDNSNPDVLTLFESRLIHSKYQWKIKLSTPSIPNYGIDQMFKLSRRHIHLCKCCHCNHWFEPDYFEHVKIPDFLGDLRDITKNTFANPKFRWQESFVACPHCGKPADLSEQHRRWVCENPDDHFVPSGFKVSPFSCPKIIFPSALVKSSVEYKRKQDFYNQRLGIALEDKESTLTASELIACLVKQEVPFTHPHVMGMDMGIDCYITIAAVMPDDQLVVVHKEKVSLFQVFERRKELVLKYRIRMCVVDYAPYTETVYRMQQADPRVFAGVYVEGKRSIEIFKVKEKEEDKDEGIETIRQVNISRNKAFDYIMGEVRAGRIHVLAEAGTTAETMSENDAMWVMHCQDMKRVRVVGTDGETVFQWQKVTGEDHYHHSLCYCIIASKMFTVAGNTSRLPSLMMKFRHKLNK